MRIRLTLLTIVALVALAWIAVDHGVVAGARSAQPQRASTASALSAQSIDAEASAAQAPMLENAAESSTSKATMPADDAATTERQAPPEVETSESSGSRLAALERAARAGNRKAARDWMDAIVQCASAMYGDHFDPPQTHLSYLGWNFVEPQRALRRELLGGLIDECRMLFPQTDREQAMLQARSQFEEAIRLWAASGDPLGRLMEAQVDMMAPPTLDQWRQQQTWATAHLNASDPQTLVDLAEAFTAGSRFNSDAAWRLAACDLGYDCAAGGALQRQMCLRESHCFSGSYEQELLQRMPPREWQIAQAQRQMLVEMIRRGDIAAIFDVPPPGP